MSRAGWAALVVLLKMLVAAPEAANGKRDQAVGAAEGLQADLQHVPPMMGQCLGPGSTTATQPRCRAGQAPAACIPIIG